MNEMNVCSDDVGKAAKQSQSETHAQALRRVMQRNDNELQHDSHDRNANQRINAHDRIKSAIVFVRKQGKTVVWNGPLWSVDACSPTRPHRHTKQTRKWNCSEQNCNADSPDRVERSAYSLVKNDLIFGNSSNRATTVQLEPIRNKVPRPN